MVTLITILHIILCVLLILIVLVQAGKGGGMGAAFGGASQQVFGARGPGTFLSKLTAAFAIGFFITSISLANLSSRESSRLKELAEQQEKEKAGKDAQKAKATETEKRAEEKTTTEETTPSEGATQAESPDTKSEKAPEELPAEKKAE
ncbi:MAG: hypothetical protein Kow0090_20990 [Myxococcota bacterium]